MKPFWLEENKLVILNGDKKLGMSATKKKTNTRDFYESGIISDKVKDRSNDPYFVKKAEEAKEFLREHPIPGSVK